MYYYEIEKVLDCTASEYLKDALTDFKVDFENTMFKTRYVVLDSTYESCEKSYTTIESAIAEILSYYESSLEYIIFDIKELKIIELDVDLKISAK